MTNDERDKAIKDIASKVGDIHTDMSVLKECVQRHDKTLYGNGRAGIVERFQSVEEQQRSCPALQEKLLGNTLAKKANWIQIAMLIVTIIAVIIAIIAN